MYTVKQNNMLDDVVSKIIRFDADLEERDIEEYYTTVRKLLSHKWGVVFDRVSAARQYQEDVQANLEKLKQEILSCQQPLDRDETFYD